MTSAVSDNLFSQPVVTFCKLSLSTHYLRRYRVNQIRPTDSLHRGLYAIYFDVTKYISVKRQEEKTTFPFSLCILSDLL